MGVKKDLAYTFALSRYSLQLLGVWPDPCTSSRDHRRPKIRFIIAICIMSIYMIIPQTLKVIYSRGNVGLMVKHLAPVTFGIMAIIKLFVTWYHGESLRTVITSIADDWTTSKETWERNTMLKFARCGRNLSFRSYVSIIMTHMLYLYTHLTKFFRNLHQPVDKRSLIYHFDFYNTKKSPNYEITYYFQMSCGTISTLTNTAVDSFVAMLLLHISAQLTNLRVMLDELVKKLAKKSISCSMFKKDLAAIIVRHENLIRRAETIDRCYSTALFVYMITTTLQMCFQSFQFYMIINDKNTSSLGVSLVYMGLYATLMMHQLYIYCYSAERLIAESTSVAYGVYECKWYNLPSTEAKDLMFIVYRSRIPLTLTAGKFGIFSLEMFENTVKTSMGYLSMLMTVNK